MKEIWYIAKPRDDDRQPDVTKSVDDRIFFSKEEADKFRKKILIEQELNTDVFHAFVVNPDFDKNISLQILCVKVGKIYNSDMTWEEKIEKITEDECMSEAEIDLDLSGDAENDVKLIYEALKNKLSTHG